MLMQEHVTALSEQVDWVIVVESVEVIHFAASESHADRRTFVELAKDGDQNLVRETDESKIFRPLCWSREGWSTDGQRNNRRIRHC